MATLFSGGGESPNLSGSMNLKVGDFYRPADEVILAINVNDDEIGGWKKRPGSTKVGATITAGADVTFLHQYSKVGVANRLLEFLEDGTVKYWNESIHQAVTTGLTTSTQFSMTDFLNMVFIVGYASGSSTFLTPAVISANPPAYSTTNDNLVNMPKAKHIIRYLDKLYAMNVELNGVLYPSRVYVSSGPISGAITWSTSEATGDWFPVPEDNNEEIMGGAENANRLLIFKENSLWKWDESSLTQVSNIGTCSADTIQTIEEFTIFANRKGMYMTSGSKPRKISRKLDPLFKRITQSALSSLKSMQDDNHYYLFVGDVTFPLKGKDEYVGTNLVIVYTLSTQNLFVYRFPDPIKSMGTFTDSNNKKRVYFGNADGEVFKLAEDVDSVKDDDGEPITGQVRYRTYFASPAQQKDSKRAYVFMDTAVGANFRTRVDNKDWQNENQITKTPVADFPINTCGYMFDFEITETSANDPFQLNGFGIEVDQATFKK